MIRGYARVSTQDQDLAGQLASLKAAGSEEIYREKISGAKADRPELQKLLKNIRSGDVLLVTRLDRLARSTHDLLVILKRVSDVGATFKSLGDPWADFTTPHGKLMLTMLGALAEFERSLILARTQEGRARARAAGKRVGGPRRKLTPEQQETARQRLANNEHPAFIGGCYGVSEATIRRLRPKSR